MYKIYINETPLFILDTKAPEIEKYTSGNYLVMKATGKQKQFFQIIDSLEKIKRFEAVILYGDDPDELFEKFSSLFKILEAAGGIVENKDAEVLFIYRRGFWDLPKGKIDKGESPEQAALREVEEETGLSKVDLGNLIGTTWHTYRTPKNRILKKTYWFAMHTLQTDLKLQSEEDIEDASWSDVKDFLSKKPTIYNSIVDILQQYNQSQN